LKKHAEVLRVRRWEKQKIVELKSWRAGRRGPKNIVRGYERGATRRSNEVGDKGGVETWSKKKTAKEKLLSKNAPWGRKREPGSSKRV